MLRKKFTDTVKSMPKVLKRHRISIVLSISPMTSITKEDTLRGNTNGNYFKIISLPTEKSSLTKWLRCRVLSLMLNRDKQSRKHFCGICAKYTQSQPKREKSLDNPKFRDILANNWWFLFKSTVTEEKILMKHHKLEQIKIYN